MSQMIQWIKTTWNEYWTPKSIPVSEQLQNAYYGLDELESNYWAAQDSDPQGHWEYKLDQAKGIVEHIEFIIANEKK